MSSNGLWADLIAQWLGEAVELVKVDEIRDWSQSRVIRISTRANGAEHVIYAKQARIEHACEATIYQLADRVKGFPAPKGRSIVIDGEDWLLIEQAAGKPLARCQDIQRYKEAVCGLAAFHQHSLDEHWLEQLPGLTNVIQRLDQLSDTVIASVLSCADGGIFTELDRGLASRVQRELDESWPSTRADLQSYPTNLIHGDSHSGNIFVCGGQIQFVDWGSAAAAPGMLDLIGLMDVAARMNDAIGSKEELMELYWMRIPEEARQQYKSLPRAYRVLQIGRSLLELDWFSQSADDYGQRANRELTIIARSLAALV